MQNKTILIVEDDTIIAADLQDRLTDLGYIVLASIHTGEEALSRIRHWASTKQGEGIPDLVLLDIQLAGELDGIQTAIQLRKLADVPMIFLTSNSDEAVFRRARQAQPRAFITKPFRDRDLVHAIELAIGSTATRQQQKGPTQINKDRLFIKVRERLVRLLLTDIIYLEANDYYCKVYTEERSYLVTKTLKKLSAQLPPEAPFFRCHRSYVVNLRRITEIGDLYVFLGDHRIPLSRSKRAEVIALVNKL